MKRTVLLLGLILIVSAIMFIPKTYASDVTNIIHFGLPVSKNEYVQEVGRAGRGDEHPSRVLQG